MASTKISIGSVGISGHLMGLLRKTTDLATVAASFDSYPYGNNGNFEFLSLEPGMYRFEVRDSPDGVALGTLIGPVYSIEVRSDQLELEYLFYTADGPDLQDPPSGQFDIIDPYLDGKNVQGVFKESFRFLQKFLEYTLIPGGGIHIEGGTPLSPQEVIQVIIANVVPVVATTAGLFAGSMLITADTTVDATYVNRKTKCAATGTRLKITLPNLSTLVDGKFFYFTTHSGNQYNTVFITTGGEQIEGYGDTIVLGKYEFLYIEKRGPFWEVLDVSPGVQMVGERFSAGFKSHPNTLPEDDTLIDSLDRPRLFNWVKNVLPATHKITTTDAAIAGYARTDDKLGLFIISETKLRMPNTQNLSERGLLSFNTYGTDTQRLYDYPMGTQLPQVGPHWHDVETQNLNSVTKFLRSILHSVRSWNATPQSDPNQTSSTDINKLGDNTTYATENRVKNYGVIFSRRI